MRKKSVGTQPEFTFTPLPTLSLPFSAKTDALVQRACDELIEELDRLRAGQLVAYQHRRDIDHRPPVVLLPTAKKAMGYIEKYGLSVARRERYAVLELVKAHLARFSVVGEMLQGLEALCDKASMDTAAAEVKTAREAFNGLGEAIASSIVAERGPLQLTMRFTFNEKGGDAKWEGESDEETSISLAT